MSKKIVWKRTVLQRLCIAGMLSTGLSYGVALAAPSPLDTVSGLGSVNTNSDLLNYADYQTDFDDDIDCNDNCDDVDDKVIIDDIDDDAVLDPSEDNFQSAVVSDDSPDININTNYVPLNAIAPETIETFVEVIDVIRKDYIRPVNDEALFKHAITGMLQNLDKHAEYLSPDNLDKLKSFTDGEIGQVGISATYNPIKQAWIIDSVASQSSAKAAGVDVGDQLISIKKAELKSDMEPQDIKQLLSGIAGSQVQVVVKDASGQERKLELQRNLSMDNKLQVSVQEGIAVVRLPVFQNSSKDQLINVLKQIGEPVTGVVIDVRNNPGGVLSSAIDIASLFITDDDLIQVRNRTNKAQIIKPNGTPYFADLPVVILQNRYSASASEVLASSFKSNNRAKIVGEQSFGKGTVQEVIPLESGGALKLTVAEYRSAKGDLIDGVGIKPDVTFMHDGSDWQRKAMTLLLSQDRSVGVKFDSELNGIEVQDDY